VLIEFKLVFKIELMTIPDTPQAFLTTRALAARGVALARVRLSACQSLATLRPDAPTP
jgi:hypothetical protein